MSSLTNYRSVLAFKVPADSKWEPKMAVQISTGLFATEVPFNLVIRANTTTIKWQIEIAHVHATTVKNLIRAAIPRVEVDEYRKATIDRGFYIYQLEGNFPFIGYLKDAVDCPQDPLFSLVGNMHGLENNEEIVYELVCGLPTLNYKEQGNQMLTMSGIDWTKVKSIEAGFSAMSAKNSGADRISRFDNDIDKPARQKMKLPLREVNVLLKIKASNRAQTDAIYNRVVTGFAPFDEANNFLIGAFGYPLVLCPAEIAALWHLPTEEIKTQGVEWTKGIYAPIPPALMNASKTNTVQLGISSSHGKEYPVYLAYPDRNIHLNIVGGSGLGKSTFIHNLVHQDIKNGHGVAVLDPHGDLIKKILRCSIPENRINDVVLVDLDDRDFPVGLNFLAPQTGLSPDDATDQILAVFRKIFDDDWSKTRMEELVYNALAALANYPGATLLDIQELLKDATFRQKVLRTCDDPYVKKYWLLEYADMSDSIKDVSARPISSRLSKFYRSKIVRPLMCQTTSLDFRHIMDSRKILLINVRPLAEPDMEIVGAMIIARILMAVMSRGDIDISQRVPFYFYIDEVQSFLTSSLDTFFTQARKFGISLSVGNQNFDQLDKKTLESVLGNVGTNIIFGVGDTDARLLSRVVGQGITPNDLMHLDKGQAVVKMRLAGQKLPAFSMLTANDPPEQNNADETVGRIRELSRAQYAKPLEDVLNEFKRRYGLDDDDTGDTTDEGGRTGNFFE